MSVDITGFEKMTLKKVNFLRVNGQYFALFGVANVGVYLLSKYMKRDSFEYHFQYKGEGQRAFLPIKSMVASDSIYNLGWTAPTLIGLSYFLN